MNWWSTKSARKINNHYLNDDSLAFCMETYRKQKPPKQYIKVPRVEEGLPQDRCSACREIRTVYVHTLEGLIKAWHMVTARKNTAEADALMGRRKMACAIELYTLANEKAVDNHSPNPANPAAPEDVATLPVAAGADARDGGSVGNHSPNPPNPATPGDVATLPVAAGADARDGGGVAANRDSMQDDSAGEGLRPRAPDPPRNEQSQWLFGPTLTVKEIWRTWEASLASRVGGTCGAANLIQVIFGSKPKEG